MLEIWFLFQFFKDKITFCLFQIATTIRQETFRFDVCGPALDKVRLMVEIASEKKGANSVLIYSPQFLELFGINFLYCLFYYYFFRKRNKSKRTQQRNGIEIDRFIFVIYYFFLFIYY